jgi:S1-C subfamily serine protease/Flp pilus assembly protein TadD
LGTGTLLLLLSTLAFRGRDTQQQAENSQASSGTGFDVFEELKHEALAAEEKARNSTDENQDPAENAQSSMPTGKVLELADLAELVGPSVVHVKMNSYTGSGFVLDREGTIVTNFHVIEDETVGTIVFSDRTTAPIVGYLGVWPEKDIALLKVECKPDKLHPLPLATSTPRQGERVAAFGSPQGLQQTMTEGICSAIRESEELHTLIPTDIDAILIQTNAPISQGNSGGPLVNLQGMVVGINTLASNQSIQNLNFAVSIAELPPLLLTRSESVLPLPAKDPAGKVRRIVARANEHYYNGNYDHAIALYTEAIRLDPTYSLAYYGRGKSYFTTNKCDHAIADCTEAIRLDPINSEYYSLRGYLYDFAGDYDRAIVDHSLAVRFDPRKSKSYRYRGNAYLRRGDYDRAIADYDEAIRLAPEDSSNYSNRGDSYCAKLDLNRAIADYDEAIRLKPKFTSYYSKRANAHFLKGDYDHAIDDYSEAIVLNPSDLAYYERGNCYLKRKDYDKAIADFTEAIRLEPQLEGLKHGCLISRGDAYREKRDYDNAIADYTEVIRLAPEKRAEAHWKRGKAYELKGQRMIARGDFEQAAKMGYDSSNSK